MAQWVAPSKALRDSSLLKPQNLVDSRESRSGDTVCVPFVPFVYQYWQVHSLPGGLLPLRLRNRTMARLRRRRTPTAHNGVARVVSSRTLAKVRYNRRTAISRTSKARAITTARERSRKIKGTASTTGRRLLRRPTTDNKIMASMTMDRLLRRSSRTCTPGVKIPAGPLCNR